MHAYACAQVSWLHVALRFGQVAALDCVGGIEVGGLAVAAFGVNGAVGAGGLVTITILVAALPPGVNVMMILAALVLVAVFVAVLVTVTVDVLASVPVDVLVAASVAACVPRFAEFPSVRLLALLDVP
jgi:hypothetical protein